MSCHDMTESGESWKHSHVMPSVQLGNGPADPNTCPDYRSSQGLWVWGLGHFAVGGGQAAKPSAALG